MSIDFKFKADAHFETIELEGKAFISVADLRQIVTDRRLNGSAGAFGLKLSNAQTGQGDVPRPHRTPPSHVATSWCSRDLGLH